MHVFFTHGASGARSAIALGMLALGACGSDDPGEPSEPTWHELGTAEPASLLSVWGESSDDVWVVGGRADLAGPPTVLHYEDGSWSHVDPGVTGIDLWWVFGVPGGDVFFGGSGGTILRYRNAAFERMPTPRSGIVFGIWGPSADDLWAVGGGGIDPVIVWHYDGAQWTDVPQPADMPPRVFKVHGRATDDVWMSCADGTALHWDGAALAREATGVAVPLFSIVTTPERAIAVGGTTGVGEIVERGGPEWTSAGLNPTVAWRGVAARGELAYAIGERGVVARRDAAGWTRVEQSAAQGNFHAAWIDPAGGLWGAGGDFNRTPLTTDGFLLYFGARDIAPIPR